MRRYLALKPQCILGAAFLMFLGVAFLSFHNTQRHRQRTQDVAVMRMRLDLFNRLLNSLLEAESAQRGYILTFQPAFLEKYRAAEHDVMAQRDDIRDDADGEAALVEKLDQLTREEMSRLHQGIDLRSDRGFLPAIKAVEDRAEGDNMNKIRRTLVELRAHELSRLDARTRAAERSARDSLVSTVALMILAAILVAIANTLIFRDAKRREQAEQVSALAQERNTVWAHELENTHQETRVLNDFTETLAVCFSEQEAYEAIAAFHQRIFPAAHGALAVLNNSHNLLEVALAWNPPAEGEQVFGPEDCHALRCGRMYEREIGSLKLVCHHVTDGQNKNYVCTPLVAQGETLGVLHLDFDRLKWAEKQLKLAANMATHAAMKLANLKLRDKLKSQSVRDALTGLYNRRYMEECLERELSRAGRSGKPVGVIMADLDCFKRFNDSFGHEAGDRVLQEVAAVLLDSFRREDIVCRYGGEELLVIVPEIGHEEVIQRAELVRERIHQIRIQHQQQLLGAITVSFGVASYPKDAKTQAELLHQADVALYQAKRAGRDRVVAYSVSADEFETDHASAVVPEFVGLPPAGERASLAIPRG